MNNTNCQPMAKRLLSVLFAITLVMGLVPISAYAAIGDAAGDKAEAATTGQEQGTQGTDSQDASKDNKDADSDSNASDKGASTEEPATEEGPTEDATTSPSNGNDVSSNENAISLADNGIAVVADNGSAWKYNGGTGLAEDSVYSTLADAFKYRSIVGKVSYAAYKIDGKTFSLLSESNKWYPKSGTYIVQGSKYGIVGNYENVGTVTITKQWDTKFTSNIDNAGATDVDGNLLSKLTSDDGTDVKFKVKQVAVSGTEGVYYDAVVTCDGVTLTPENGVYSIKAKANSAVNVEYQTPKATIKVDYDTGADKVTVGNDVVTDPEQDVQVSVGFETPASVTPKEGYAVTSVKLTGGSYSEYELLTAGSFADSENRTATFAIPSDLDKTVAYTLSIETKQCELKLQDSPSAAVRGLTDTAKIKQRVIEGTLAEDSLPSGKVIADQIQNDPECVTVEYVAGYFLEQPIWQGISYDPITPITHKFGTQSSEKIRITYNGNVQYCKLSSGEFSIQIVDGRTPTYITTNESVSVKYVSDEDELKNTIKAALEAKVFDEETGEQIPNADVDFDFDHKAGTQTITVKYAGNEDYKNSETTVELKIAKGDAKVTVNSQSITYDEQFTTPLVSATPSNSEAWPIYAIVGIDGTGSTYVSIDFSSVVISEKTPWGSTVNVKLQDVITRILGKEFSASAVLDNLDYIEDALSVLGITDASEICSNIRKVLEAVEKIAPGVMDSKIALGGTPSQAGVYGVAAVSVNPNYVNDVAVGYLTIAPATQDVELKFKSKLPSYSMTIDEAKSFDFSVGLYQRGQDITGKGKVTSRFIGTDYEGNVYASASVPTVPGVYSQVVTNIGGNYFASPISRVFRIARVDTELSISFEGATSTGDNKQSVVYTGSQVTPTFKVTSGDTVLDSSSVEAYYVDLSQGYWKSEPPTNVGTYTVYASYPGTSYYGQSTAKCELTIERQSINLDDDTYRGVTVEDIDDVVYDGTEHVLNPVVKDAAGNDLVRKTDYVVHYSTDDFTNVGEVDVTITGIGNYTGQVERTYTIEKAAIKVADSATRVYNGTEQMFYVQATDATGLAEGEVLTLSDAQVKGTEPGVYTEVSPYKWEVVKADGKTDSTGNYTINVSGTLTITAADSAAADTNNGNGTKADKGTAPQTGDTTAPLAAGAAFAAAAALVALFVSRKLRRNGTR